MWPHRLKKIFFSHKYWGGEELHYLSYLNRIWHCNVTLLNKPNAQDQHTTSPKVKDRHKPLAKGLYLEKPKKKKKPTTIHGLCYI